MSIFLISSVVTLLTLHCNGHIICKLLINSSVDEIDTINSKCIKQMKVLCNNRNSSVLWQMLDASSKYPTSGMLYGRNRDLGNFDECININYESTVKGKFCAFNLAIYNVTLHFLTMNLKLGVLAENPKVKYNYDGISLSIKPLPTDDVSTSILSLCIPDKCSPKEVGKYFIWGNIFTIANSSLVRFIDNIPCMTKDSNSYFKWGDIFFIVFLAVVLLLIACSTAYDFFLSNFNREPKNPILLAFSLITNCKRLLHTSQNNPEQIQCLNGLRFISTMWVMAHHNYMFLQWVPLTNYTTLDQYRSKLYTQYMGSASTAVDTFFFLSGLLLSYGYLKSAAKMSPKKQLLGFPKKILQRYLRLTPALAVTYFATITIFRIIGTGPLWDVKYNQLTNLCGKYWWSFFFYVQNYVNYNDLCLGHTWYLSADMQMFILSPLVLIPITILIKKSKAVLAFGGLALLTTACAVFPVLTRFLDHSIGNSFVTHSRLTDYLTGIILGVILRQYKPNPFPFSKLVNFAIWFMVLAVCLSFSLVYHFIVRGDERKNDNLFYRLYRPIWCPSLAWIVYSCYHGYGGPINWLLSRPVFQIGARLSYCMYLLHILVEIYWVKTARTPFYWDDYANFYVWCGHFIVTIILSAVWTLAFESPVSVIIAFMLNGSTK